MVPKGAGMINRFRTFSEFGVVAQLLDRRGCSALDRSGDESAVGDVCSRRVNGTEGSV